MELRRYIEMFCGPDEAKAREALDVLHPHICLFLNQHLRSIVPIESDREDAIVATLFRLFKYRGKIRFDGVGRWWALVGRIGKNCALTQLCRSEEAELTGDFTEHEITFLDKAGYAFEHGIDIYRLADAVWLQIPLEMSAAERRRRLLAAQLYYVDKVPWPDVCAIVGHTLPIERRLLDEWLSSKTVLLDLIYHRLYWNNERLTGYVLRPARPLSPEEINSLAADPTAIQLDWSPGAVRVLTLRFRNGLLKEKIAQLLPDLDKSEIEGWIAQATEQLPFAAIARELLEALKNSQHPPEIFASGNIWKRLVFQYYASFELPQRQILERIEPASSETGFHLTSGMLNVWISNERLINELIKFLEGGGFYGGA